MEKVLFGAGDYAVFGIMLAIPLAIGIFYGVRDRRKKKVEDYLLGGRSMNFWSVGVSLSFTFISAVTILGIPAELYLFGAMYFWLVSCLFLVVPVVTEIYIPLYFRLKISSSYQYLEYRFGYPARLVGTAAYIAQTILYLGVMIYAPSLAFSQVSGFSLWAAIFTTGIVCTIYTTLGGLKAVIWTDVFQGCAVIIVQLIVMFLSANESGGWDAVWEANRKTNRLEFFHFDLDPRFRHSVWSVFFGLGFLWTSAFCTAQSQVQRYFACRSESDAKKSFLLCTAISVFTLLLSLLVGWVMYAYFQNCDPIFSKQVTAPDQLLPLMVMRVFRNAPGASGLFMAGVYAGALSTVSSGINAMGCVTVEDFIKPFVTWRESTLTIVSKVLVCFYGITSIGFACLSSILGNVLQTSLSLLGILGGPLLGLFTLGIVFPFANTAGSLIGFFLGLFLTSWIFGGSLIYPPPLKYLRPTYRTIAGCVSTAATTMNSSLLSTTESAFSPMSTFPQSVGNINMTELTTIQTVAAVRPAIAELYSVSYAYYSPIGFGATVIIGIIFSLLTFGHRKIGDVDPKLIVALLDHRVVKNLFPKSFRKMMRCGVRHEKQVADVSGVSNAAMNIDEEHPYSSTLPGMNIKGVEITRLKHKYDEVL